MVRVAAKAFALLAFVLTIHVTVAQQRPTAVSLQVQSQHLSVVIEKLGSITGLNFIYSSDKIDARQLITFSAVNQSIDDVLAEIATKTNLTFKRHSRYVIIKVGTAPAIVKVSEPVKPVVVEEIAAPRPEPVRSAKLLASLNAVTLSEQNLKKYLPDISPYFNAGSRSLPGYSLSMNPARKLHYLFVSVGPILNEYSAGVEFQLGFRRLYMVTDMSILSNGDMLNGYGLGTNLRLTDRLALRPMYSFSAYRKFDQELHYGADGRMFMTNFVANSRYHKMKWMLQYAAAGKITLSIGPTFNMLRSEITYSGVRPVSSYSSSDYRKQSTIFTVPEGSTQISKSWLGWEASIGYRITFGNN